MIDNGLGTKTDKRIAGGVVGVIGLLFIGIHFAHGIGEFHEELSAVVYGVVLPLLVSVLIVSSSYWIMRQEWENASPWRQVGWFLGSILAGFALIGLLIFYQRAEGGTLSDPQFVIAMFGTYGGAVGLLLGWYDVQRQREQIVQEQKTDRFEQFASIVSHDLRSPLNVATGRLELAREDCDSDQLKAIEDTLDQMESLIEKVLTLARAGEDAIEIEVVSLAELAESCWRTVGTDEATIRIDTDSLVRADKQQLRQLFENLFKNAIEHGDETVTVAVGDLQSGFYVADDGNGIPEAERSEIFEAGYTTGSNGTGLGLAIVNEIVDAHNWTIRVTESVDGGARFEINGVDFEQ